MKETREGSLVAQPPRVRRIPTGTRCAGIDQVHFLEKSNASLKKIERVSLLIVCLSSAGAFFFSKEMGLSSVIGGFLSMLHFRSLHRMFQKRVTHPAATLRTRFIYSVTLFFITGFFFWAVRHQGISTPGLVTGFLLTTGAVFLESSRRT